MAQLEATRDEIRAFPRELGRRFKGQGALYLVGGSMLVYQGYRQRTVHVDYRIELTEGDHGEFVRAMRETKHVIPLDVEPANGSSWNPLSCTLNLLPHL